MTDEQATAVLTSNGAKYVTTKQGVQWWKTQDGSWIAKSVQGLDVKLQRLHGNACGC